MSTKFTPSFIASQKALEEKATRRPWVAEWNFEHHEKGRTVEYYEAWAETPVITGSSLSEVEPQVAADRLYMEAAANNFPAALDEIELLRALLAMKDDALSSYAEFYDKCAELAWLKGADHSSETDNLIFNAIQKGCEE